MTRKPGKKQKENPARCAEEKKCAEERRREKDVDSAKFEFRDEITRKCEVKRGSEGREGRRGGRGKG